MADDRKDLPSASATNWAQRVNETLRTYMGKAGPVLDRGVTVRDLVNAGIADLKAGGNFSGLKPGANIGQGAIGPQGPPGPAVPYEPDLTPPPTPTGFTAVAAISNILLEHAVPSYTQGHGHGRTRVYGATWTSGALPTFSAAVEITQFSGTVFAYATNPASTWHLWIKWESADGVLSSSPAGGTNGVAVTTGQDVSKLVAAMTGPGNPFKVVAVSTTLPDGSVVPAGTYTADAFIHNGQITNAKIANLAVDNAKIASLAVSKLTAGSIAVGQYIQSTSYVAGSAGWRINGNGTAEFAAASIRGQLTAAQINTNGLDIRDSAGNVVFQSGKTLKEQALTVGNQNLVSTLEKWGYGAGTWRYDNEHQSYDKNAIVIPAGVTYQSANSPQMNLTPYGATFTVSFKALCGERRTLFVDLYPDTLPESNVLLEVGWHTYSFTWNSSHADMSACRLRFFAGSENSQIEVCDIKLEAGAYATQLAYNPNDVVSAYNRINSANASTFIANAALGIATIDTASITNLSALSAKMGNITSGTLDIQGDGGTGWGYARSQGKWWADGVNGWVFARDGSNGDTFAEIKAGAGRLWFSSWGDYGIEMPGIRMTNSGLTIDQINVINTLSINGGAVTESYLASAGPSSGTTTVCSLTFTVPTGQTWQIFASGSAALSASGSNPSSGGGSVAFTSSVSLTYAGVQHDVASVTANAVSGQSASASATGFVQHTQSYAAGSSVTVQLVVTGTSSRARLSVLVLKK